MASEGEGDMHDGDIGNLAAIIEDMKNFIIIMEAGSDFMSLISDDSSGSDGILAKEAIFYRKGFNLRHLYKIDSTLCGVRGKENSARRFQIGEPKLPVRLILPVFPGAMVVEPL